MTRNERVKKGLLRVGELAERAGVLSSTIRHYTNVGLLYSASTTPGGHRLYEEKESLARLRKIKRLNSHRPTLAQIRERIDRQFNSGEKNEERTRNST